MSFDRIDMGAASRINYLSQPLEVEMADDWFGLATLDHFWIRRRMEVVRRLCGGLFSVNAMVGEIGCGSGVVQRQIEDGFGLSVDGFDLNEFALEHNISRRSSVNCYDIHQRNAELKRKYDVLLMFDVLEHLPDDARFLESAKFHVKPGGSIVVNVPAMQSLFSAYDKAAGHQRRYDRAMMVSLANRTGLAVSSFTYWGLPLVPLLLIRKALSRGEPDTNTIRKGFKPANRLVNAALGVLASLEPLPHSLYGTSLMCVLSVPK